MSPALGEVEDAAHLGLGQMLLRDDLGVLVGLDPEALVVGEVQAELVVLQISKLTDPVLDPPCREVLARDVQHEPALRLRRTVAYDSLGRRSVRPHRLLQGACPIEHARVGGPADPHPPVFDGHRVRLGSGLLVGERQLYVPGAGLACPRVPELQLPGEQPPFVREVGVVHDHAAPAGRTPAGSAGGRVLAYGRDRPRCRRHRVRTTGGRRGRGRVGGLLCHRGVSPVRPQRDRQGRGCRHGHSGPDQQRPLAPGQLGLPARHRPAPTPVHHRSPNHLPCSFPRNPGLGPGPQLTTPPSTTRSETLPSG